MPAKSKDARKKQRKWFVTDWPQEGETWEDVYDMWNKVDWSRCRYAIYQVEIGEKSGKPHVQAMVHTQRAVAKSWIYNTLLQRPKASVEPVESDDAAAHYCEKPVTGCLCKHCKKARAYDSRLTEPVEIGTRPAYGVTAQTPTDAVAEMITQGWSDEVIAREAPWALLRFGKGIANLRKAHFKSEARKRREVTVILLTGAAGTGKTSWVEDTYGVDNYYSPNMEGSKLWFDDYCGEKVLLLDDYRGGVTSLGNLLKYMDGRPKVQLQVKGSHLYALWDTVVITSNTEPTDWHTELQTQYGDLDEIEAFWRRVSFHINDVTEKWSPDNRSNAITEALKEKGWKHP